MIGFSLSRSQGIVSSILTSLRTFPVHEEQVDRCLPKDQMDNIDRFQRERNDQKNLQNPLESRDIRLKIRLIISLNEWVNARKPHHRSLP